VSKTSSGALELVDVCEVRDAVGFMREWRKMEDGRARVLCTGMEAKEGIPLIKLSEYKKSGSDLVLIGSEGAGVSPHLVKESTAILTIEKKSSLEFPDSLVDSLNVNAAVATILYELTKS
jgi:tRNA G18 (ribose-2'-O)-methylase SpoU